MRPAFSMYRRFLLGIVIVMLSSASAVAAAGILELHDDASIFREHSRTIANIESALDGVDPGGPQTIMLLGSDQRWVDIQTKAPVRSDTIILVRLDPSKGATAIMSLPRDLKVRIPGHGTDKINAAYAIGGPALTVRTVRSLLKIPIHHVININFGGFRRAVNRLGCVYTDIDRRYFNDNNPPFGGGPKYATIDIKAGYQRICGQDALDFVRYRHLDNDIVRAARQQQFLADAKDQIGTGKLFADRKELIKIFGRYTQTDIRSDDAILRLIKLAVLSAEKPVQEVRFPGRFEGEFVTVSERELAEVTRRFMNARGTGGPRGTVRRTRSSKPRGGQRRSSGLPPGMLAATRQGEDQAARLATRTGFPVYYPRAIVAGAQYMTDHSRAYTITDRGGHKYRAYRIVVKTNELGQYYGIQGTTWPSPPILDNPSERRKMAGRTYELFYDGTRLRLVAWRSGNARYWISNTLLHSLSNQKMLALARSVAKIS